MRSHKLRGKVSLLLLLAILLFTYGTYTVFAVPPVSPYTPGAILDPNCVPGSANCTVQVLDASDEGVSFGSNIFSIDFVGAGITATEAGGALTVTVPGGGAALVLYDENPVLPSAPTASGTNAVAIGNGANATGEAAVSLGGENTGIGTGASTASGIASLATGSDGLASGFASAVFGWQNTAGNAMAAAFGEQTTASGQRAVTFGSQTQATGNNSTAFGTTTQATGDSAFVLGFDSTASGDFSFAQGNQTEAYSAYETVFGSFQTTYTPDSTTAFDTDDRLFVLGNGSSSIARNNALTVIKDGTFILNDDDTTWTSGDEEKFFFDPSNRAIRGGSVDSNAWEGVNVGDGSIALGFTNTGFGLGAPIASGDNSFATGTGTTASGIASTVTGAGNTASGGASFAGGQFSTASGDLSFAFGDGAIASANDAVAFGGSTTASGDTSTAFGADTVASGTTSTAFGNQTTASGTNATAFGFTNEAFSFAETVFGSNATTYTPDSATAFDTDDRLFVVGNGNGTPLDADEFSNALTIFKNGTFIVNDDNTTYNSLGGEEKKLFFDVVNNAFRAGSVTTTEWEGANAGDKSVAIGFGGAITGNPGGNGPVASGDRSLAFGTAAIASGEGAVAMGAPSTAFGFTGPTASGNNSFATGSGTDAQGANAATFGLGTVASGDHSFAAGIGSDAVGYASIAFGSSAANGDISGAIGNGNVVDGDSAFAAGALLEAPSFAEIALGFQSTTYVAASSTTTNGADRILTVGNGAGSTHSDALTILKDGHVGIGIDNYEATETAGFLLEVGDSTYSANTGRLRVENVSGTCDIDPTVGTLACSSDSRRKKEINTIQDSLSKVLGLRSVQYRWNSDTEDAPLRFGFIAQELEQIFPELVITDADGMKSVAYTNLIPFLAQAIQQLNNKIDLVSAGTVTGAEVGELVVDRLRAREICLDDVCIDRDSLQQILDATGADSVSDTGGTQGQSGDVPPTDGDNGQPGDTEGGTENPGEIDNPAPEPGPGDVPDEPAPEPEPSPDPEPSPEPISTE